MLTVDHAGLGLTEHFYKLNIIARKQLKSWVGGFYSLIITPKDCAEPVAGAPSFSSGAVYFAIERCSH